MKVGDLHAFGQLVIWSFDKCRKGDSEDLKF